MESSTQSSQCVVPHLDVEVDPRQLKESFLPVLTVIKPSWKVDNFRTNLSPLSSDRGLLNAMVRCYNAEDPSDAIMVRVLNTGANNLFEDRSNEINGIKHLYEKGCAPRILATFKNGFCYEFIPGEVLTHQRLQEEPIWSRIAEEFAKYHTGTYEDATINKKRIYWTEMTLKQLDSFPKQLKNPQKNQIFQNEFPSCETLKNEVDLILNHIEKLGSPIVLCHNDSRPENIIWNAKTGTIHFVDFEAIGYNYQALEIASHFNRYTGMNPPDSSLYPSKQLQHQWLRIYLQKSYALKGQNPADVTDLQVMRLQVQVEKCRLFDLLLCACWVSLTDLLEETSSGEMDYLAFALETWKDYCRLKDDTLAMTVP